MISETEGKPPAARNQVDHAADRLACYPGDTIALFTRVSIGTERRHCRVRISFPSGFALISSKAISQPERAMPMVAMDEGTTHILWDIDRLAETGNVFEYQTQVRVLPTLNDATLETKAVLTSESDGEDSLYLDERVSVAVKAKSRYLKYLPSIYHDDELMGRLLMLFESFLDPIEKQINQQENYLDPKMAPPEFLGWLASWLGLVFDESLSDQRRRHLLKEAAGLYKKRGTRKGLTDYLELVSGGRVQIKEHFSENFNLGQGAIMGQGIALGTNNVPNTFGVTLFLPAPEGVVDEEEKQRTKMIWERKSAAIIEAEKPVHSGYELEIEYESNFDQRTVG